MRLQSTLREEERKKKIQEKHQAQGKFLIHSSFICKSLILPFHANKEKRKKNLHCVVHLSNMDSEPWYHQQKQK